MGSLFGLPLIFPIMKKAKSTSKRIFRRKRRNPKLREEQKILNQMIAQNPHVETFIEMFDLELIKTPKQ